DPEPMISVTCPAASIDNVTPTSTVDQRIAFRSDVGCLFSYLRGKEIALAATKKPGEVVASAMGRNSGWPGHSLSS
ncbi:hypothetical protein, partial [Rhizobium laguerreae]|uniref:hypothetical protein n=1 Tax=Rhizobium laguerreae TaxID=1076926 RepID=UPI001C91ABD3